MQPDETLYDTTRYDTMRHDTIRYITQYSGRSPVNPPRLIRLSTLTTYADYHEYPSSLHPCSTTHHCPTHPLIRSVRIPEIRVLLIRQILKRMRICVNHDALSVRLRGVFELVAPDEHDTGDDAKDDEYSVWVMLVVHIWTFW